jgi:peptide/nickel transport system substrate-binding protein
LIAQALQGQGLPLDGPYLPGSWAYDPGLLTPYTHSPANAAAMLEEAGWTLAGDGSTRSREGQPLVLRLLSPDTPDQAAVAAQIAVQWAAIGVQSQVELLPPDVYRSRLQERSFDAALATVEPNNDPDLYDFWSQEAIVRGQNLSGWNNRLASEALEAGRRLTAADARRPYYEAFLRLFNEDLPAITLYQHVQSYALAEAVNQAELGVLTDARSRFATFAEWFLLFREVPAPCPPAGAA